MDRRKFTPAKEAIDLYHSCKEKFVYDLVTGEYNFSDEEAYKVRKIKWTPLPHIVTYWVITDGERTLEIG